ncbi:MAG: transcription termination/antitermination NusG family protein [Pseudomonadota bacterium]
MTERWYVFLVKPQQEREAAEALRRCFGGRVWLARFPQRVQRRRPSARRPAGRRSKVVMRPISGYVFLRLHMHPDFTRVSGHPSFLGMLKRPQSETSATISDVEMNDIRLAIAQDTRRLRNGRRTAAFFRLGQRVAVMAGHAGTVDEVIGSDEAWVMLERAILGKDRIRVHRNAIAAE